MKLNSNIERQCAHCKFFRSAVHGHGEPTGYCILKRYLSDLATSFGIKVDPWFETTGDFSECDRYLQYFVDDYLL